MEGISNLAAGDVLALDAELGAVDGANDAVGQVEGEFGSGVAAEIVVVLELVEVAGGCHDVEAAAVALEHGARLALQSTLDQGLGGAVLLVREGDVGEGARRCVGVDEDVVVSGHEVDPFEIRRDLLRRGQNVRVHGAVTVKLTAHVDDELLHSALDGLQDMSLELLEVVLHGDEVLTVVVLLDNLLVQAVGDTSTENVRIMGGVDLVMGRSVKCSRVLGEELNVLLSDATSLVDSLSTLCSAILQFLRLGLDFLVKTLQGRKHGTLEVPLRVQVQVHHTLEPAVSRCRHCVCNWEYYLSVGADVLKPRRNAAGALGEMMTLPQRFVHSLHARNPLYQYNRRSTL